MSSEDGEHRYFRALEELFIELRGAPLLLSPSDWETAQGWRRTGIPLDLIDRVLRDVFARRTERRGRGGVRSLKYFDSAVQKAWREVLELGGGAERGPASIAVDVAGRLASLASALPKAGAGAAARERVLALDGPAQVVEEALSAIEDELLRAEEARLDSAARAAVERETEEAIRRVSTRLDGEALAEVRARFSRRALRRRLGLPVLSLFGPIGDDGEHGAAS